MNIHAVFLELTENECVKNIQKTEIICLGDFK